MTEILVRQFQAGGPVMWPMLLCSTLMLWQLSGLALQRLPKCPPPSTTGRAALDKRLQALAVQQRSLARHSRIQGVLLLAKIAPLLGLLGTVSGMISLFASLSDTGLHNPKALSDGIAMAMITTQTGLLIGLPGLLAGWLYQRRLIRQDEQDKLPGACNAQ
ncbi:MotA/TolQ/ExbB proton channel family protein [Ferrimonas pelagia]|uniref:MotA/TolQ/ExbB proton channel domain-containing protein n=1 Tax=Ferrimonas pelagia TaxID=1177826 RepID=A0ABP9EE04_9GAMM